MGRWLPWFLGFIFVLLVVLSFFSDTPSAALLSVAAVLTAVSGFLSALAAMKKSSEEARAKSVEDCRKLLAEVDAE